MVKNCKWCGKPFKVRYGNNRYCSNECRVKADRKSKRKWRRKNPEYQKSYYRENKDKFLKSAKDYIKETQDCSNKHGNCFQCPYEDCIRN